MKVVELLVFLPVRESLKERFFCASGNRNIPELRRSLHHIINIKFNCNTQAVTSTAKNKPEVTGLKLSQFTQSREVTANFTFLEKLMVPGMTSS